MHQLLPFTLDEKRYAMRLYAVERVVRAVAITELPGAPAIIAGVFNYHGAVIPVAPIRRRFGLPAKPVSAHDVFIIGKTRDWRLALVVDSVHNVLAPDEKSVEAVSRAAPGIEGVVKLPDGMIVIYDLEAFLSLDEAGELKAAMQNQERANDKG